MSSRATLLIVGTFTLGALLLIVSLVSSMSNLTEQLREPADVLGEIEELPVP